MNLAATSKTAMGTIDESAADLAGELQAHGVGQPRIALVLGSGMGAVAEVLEAPVVLQASELRHLPQSEVAGHAGRLISGEWRGLRVLVQQGRVHLYEGWQPEEVSRSVRAFGLLGVRALVLTNAAGCLRRDWRTGGFMRITDHLNLQGVATLPVLGAGRGSVYSERLGTILEASATLLGIELQRGVYAGLLGPSYETPAEIQMLQRLGAHSVGMSTVVEAVAARAAGMEVLGLSCLTNYAAGLEALPLSHEDVLRTGQEASAAFVQLLENALPQLAGEPGLGSPKGQGPGTDRR